MINATVQIRTGHLQVQHRSYHQDPDIRKVVSDPDAVAAVLKQTPGVAAFAARTETFSLASSRERTYGVAVIGIQPDKEAGVSTLETLVRQGQYLSDADANQALVGKLLARNLKITPGDELVLLGQGRDGSVAATVVFVKGIFDSGQDDFDRNVLHIPLAVFQEVYSMGESVHRMVVLAESLEAVAPITTAVERGLQQALPQGDLAVLDWKALSPGLVEAIHMDLVSGFIFYIILIVVVAFSILNTFLMAIFERTREFGVMMAIGTSPARLTRLLLLESAGLTVLGIGMGVIAGSLVTLYFQVHGILIPGAEELASQFGLPERMYPRLSLLSVAVGSGIVLLITSVTALYPALKIRRLDPVSALATA
jgi:ABC-type lipoprotein release transport system permease subunit